MNILYCGDKPMQKGILLSSMSLIKNVDEPLNIYILTVDYREKGINYKPIDKAFAKYLKEKLNKSDIEETSRDMTGSGIGDSDASSQPAEETAETESTEQTESDFEENTEQIETDAEQIYCVLYAAPFC